MGRGILPCSWTVREKRVGRCLLDGAEGKGGQATMHPVLVSQTYSLFWEGTTEKKRIFQLLQNGVARVELRFDLPFVQSSPPLVGKDNCCLCAHADARAFTTISSERPSNITKGGWLLWTC